MHFWPFYGCSKSNPRVRARVRARVRVRLTLGGGKLLFCMQVGKKSQ